MPIAPPQWLSRPTVKSYYQIVVSFKVRNGSSAKIKIPVTLHPGESESADFPPPEGYESDPEMLESSDNLLLEGGKG
jgi:hypothetical protein